MYIQYSDNNNQSFQIFIVFLILSGIDVVE